MISDYYKILKLRRVTEAVNSMRAVIPGQIADTEFQGCIAPMSGNEVTKNSQLNINASLVLYTDNADIKATDKIIDGSNIYEVVYPYKDIIQRYYRYALNQVESAV